MINERSAAQANTPTSASIQYGYPPNHFDLMNIPPMQNPSDLYSYYPPNLYQPFGTFDDHTQWAPTDTSGGVPPPGPMQFHPQMYNPSPLDMPRNPFEYPPQPHHYPHYHPGFPTSTFAGPPSAGSSAFDMSWNPHGLSMQQMQVAAQQQMPPIGGSTLNKKPSVYDEYSASGVGDMLVQHMSSVDLGGGVDDSHNYDNGTNEVSSVGVLSANEQQQQQHQQQHRHQSNSNNLSLGSSSHPSQQSSSSGGGGPKSYASVVSSDIVNANSNNNNKSTPPVSNMPVRSSAQTLSNERHVVNSSGFPNDSSNTRSSAVNSSSGNGGGRGGGGANNQNNYSQQSRNGNTGGYNSRNHHQSSGGNGGGVLSWTNSSSPSNSRGNGDTSSNYYSGGSANYYERSSYSQQQQQQQQPSSSSSNSNKRQNSNNYQQQQNYSSRSSHNVSNGAASASAIQQPITAANQEVLDTLKRTHQYNPKDFNLSPKGARFFVIKSYSEDDVHRSIKYNIWCSTEHGNKRLDGAFREREGKGPLYLFFSVNASGHFCGMAEMMSPVDYDHKTDVWHMSDKWQGKFEVKWIYVKDVPNQQFRNIRLENNENKPVTNSRDTQEIPYEKGKLMLKTMHLYRDKTSIFDDFQYYESKQAEEVTIKKPNNNEDLPPLNMRNHSGANNNKRSTSSTNRTSSNQVEQTSQNDEIVNNDDEEEQ